MGRTKKGNNIPKVSKSVTMPLSMMNDLAAIQAMTGKEIKDLMLAFIKDGISNWKIANLPPEETKEGN